MISDQEIGQISRTIYSRRAFKCGKFSRIREMPSMLFGCRVRSTLLLSLWPPTGKFSCFAAFLYKFSNFNPSTHGNIIFHLARAVANWRGEFGEPSIWLTNKKELCSALGNPQTHTVSQRGVASRWVSLLWVESSFVKNASYSEPSFQFQWVVFQLAYLTGATAVSKQNVSLLYGNNQNGEFMANLLKMKLSGS